MFLHKADSYERNCNCVFGDNMYVLFTEVGKKEHIHFLQVLDMK